jgi:Transmembrane domain of unknown function (DUF3566)
MSADAFDDLRPRTVTNRPLTDGIDAASTVLRGPRQPTETSWSRPTDDFVIATDTATVPVLDEEGWPSDPSITARVPVVDRPIVVPAPAPAPVLVPPAIEEPTEWTEDPWVESDDGGEPDDETDPATAVVAPASITRKTLPRRPRVRKVHRIVRRIDPWSVFKIALVLSAVTFAVLLVAGAILWDLAHKTGTVDNIQGAVKELFGLQTFVIDGKKLFRASWALGAILLVAGTGMAVTGAVLFNLIADLVGGVKVTVLEQEFVVPEQRRRWLKRKPSA